MIISFKFRKADMKDKTEFEGTQKQVVKRNTKNSQ